MQGRPKYLPFFFFFSSRRRHTRSKRDWSSDVCSSDLFTFSCALPIRGYSGFITAICIGWCCSCPGICISCPRATPLAASTPAIIIAPNFALTRMSFPRLLYELCALRVLCAKCPFFFSRFLVMLYCRARCFLSRDDGLIFFLRQHANHRHHAHHSRAPIFRQAVGLRLCHNFIHPHFHERVLRESRHALRVLRDRRVMDV